MIENHENLHSDTDELVSETYRAIADERTPDYLNKAVLRDAAKAARPRYLRSVSWTRPLAWAATITLSVALVLEVSNLPAPGPEAFDGSSKLELQQSEPDAAAGAVDDAREPVLEESVPPGASVALPQSATLNATAKQMTTQRELEKPVLDEGRFEAARSRENTSDTVNAAESESRDAHMMDRTDGIARMQDSEKKEQVPAASFAPSAPVTAQKAAGLISTAVTCDEIARSSAESWHQCVLQLESAGFADEADRQRKALQEAFPDFKPH